MNNCPQTFANYLTSFDVDTVGKEQFNHIKDIEVSATTFMMPIAAWNLARWTDLVGQYYKERHGIEAHIKKPP